MDMINIWNVMPEKYQATKNISEAPSAKRSSGFINYFPIAHNTLCLPPKFCITYCLKILLGKCNTPRRI